MSKQYGPALSYLSVQDINHNHLTGSAPIQQSQREHASNCILLICLDFYHKNNIFVSLPYHTLKRSVESKHSETDKCHTHEKETIT